MTTVDCPKGHGAMVRRELAATPEQAWGGTWFDCQAPAPVPCRSVVLLPSSELLSHLRLQAPPCVTCGLPAADWPVDDPMYRLGRQQCPGCIAADIDDDMRHVRREAEL